MKTFGFALLALALLLFLIPTTSAADRSDDPGKLAPQGGGFKKKDDGKKDDGEDDDGKDGDGGSKFDEPKDDEPKFPEEPVPATFDFKDYRLTMETEDGRFWKELPISEENKKAGVVFFQQMKLPKSDDIFDVRIIVQGWEHKGQFDFDGKKVGAANYKMLAEVFYQRDLKEWKDVKDEEKPRARRLSRLINKAYRYALTGDPGGLPQRKVMYLFKHKDKTYGLTVLYTTTSAKNKKITDQVDDMLKTLKEWKEKRRR